MIGILRSFRRDHSGVAAAEMALMMPLLVILMFGGLEAGHFLWNEHKIVKGVRDGARYPGRQSFSLVDCTNGTFTDANVITRIKNVTRTGTITASKNPVVVGWDDNATEVTVSLTCNSSTNKGIYTSLANGAPVVTVSATVPYPSLFGAIAVDLSQFDLKAQSQAAVMGM